MSLPNDPGSLHAIAEQLAEAHPDRLAVDGLDGEPWSYGQLYSASLQMAAALRSLLVDCEATGYSLSVGLCAPRGPRWVAVCVAASMLGVPFVPMVQDLHANTNNEAEVKKIAATTRERNSAILKSIKPSVVVVDDSSTPREIIDLAVGVGTSKVADINSLLDGATRSVPNELQPLQPVKRESPLCLLYTGGTTKASKCAVVSQGMLAHEFVSYPLIIPDSRRDLLLGGRDGSRVLQQSSSYWGATCIGQLSLSLALRGCLVMVDTSSRSSVCVGMATMDLRSMITRFKINVVGAVPSQLAATTLDEEVQKSLLAVFTWGEKLTAPIGDEWSAKIPILIELLVATEYWLSMYRVVSPSASSGPVFTVVPGVRVTTLSEDEATAGLAKGELLLAGPSVTETGYVDEADNEGLFLQADGRRFFRTKDLIQVQQWRSEEEGGSVETLRYLGRSDMFIKLGGQWVDLEVLQEKITALPCVKEAVLLQQQQTSQADGGVEESLGGVRYQEDGERSAVHAFVIMKPFRMATMAEVQRLLPSGNVVQVHWLALEALPRHTATGKVDRRSLLGMVGGRDILPPPTDVEVERCFGYLARWSVVTAVIAVVYYLFLGLSGMFLAAHFNMCYWVFNMVNGNIWGILGRCKEPYVADEPGVRRLLRSALAWLFSAVRFTAGQLKVLDGLTRTEWGSGGGVIASFLLTGTLMIVMSLISSSKLWWFAWRGVVVVSSGLWLGRVFPRLNKHSREPSLVLRSVHGVVLAVQFNVLWWTTIGRSIEKESRVVDRVSEPGAKRWVPSWLRDCSVDLRLYDKALRRKGRSRASCRRGGAEEFLMDSVFVSPRDLRHCRDRGELAEGMFDRRAGAGEGKAMSSYEESYYYSWMDGDEPTECPLPLTVQISTQQWSEMRREALENIDRWWPEQAAGRFDEMVIDGEDYDMAREMVDEEGRRPSTSSSPARSVGQLEVSETSTTPTLGARDEESTSESEADDDEWYAGGCGEPSSSQPAVVQPEVEVGKKATSKTAKALAQRLALLVERQLAYTIEDYDAEVVSSIDSLGAVQLAHSIRTELRMAGLLTVGDVLKCRSINDLVAVVEGKSVAGVPEEERESEGSGWSKRLSRVLDKVTGVDPDGRGPKSAGVPVQIWGWNGVCVWMLEWQGDADEVDLLALQSAVQAVVARQASMRVSNDVGIGYYTFMNEALSVQGLAKYMALTRGGRWFSWIADVAYAVGRWVLWPLWGRVHFSPAVEGRPGSVRMREFSSRDALRRWIYSEKRHGSGSPVGIDIVQLDESDDGCGPVRTFVRVFVTHAFSDGFSVVPLLSDLNEAYAVARRGAHRGPRNRLLPPLRVSGAQVQSSRLRRTLMDRARDVHGDTLYPCYTIDLTTVPQSGFGHCVKLLPSIHLVLQSVGRKLGAPLDVVLLAAIVLATVRERGWRKVAKATLVVPLRDGPTEHQLVGLFADLRNVDIPLEDIPGDKGKPCATSVLNFALTLRHMVKFRRWTIPTPLSSCERLLVNLLPAQFPSESDGPERFEQNLRILPLPHGSSVSATRTLEIACDQTSRDSWALRFKCRQPDYTREDLARWLEHFQGALRDMVVDPMRPLYH
ncbi:hypothetical protein FOZ63_034100 [Perkinsus olseni]|uniref:Carrier domain-containing protein n=2 Tax=Perkinsus olseni TaxID=32597 RepID=A0A7J6ST29_PEROL|nr:hypothetical protein FOZ63_034100 [Perkinsus olseni]